MQYLQSTAHHDDEVTDLPTPTARHSTAKVQPAIPTMAVSTGQVSSIYTTRNIQVNIYINLAKLDDGLDESPTVMVVDKKQKTRSK